ncbi:MAG: intermembrane transport protein PqiB, partial [Kangiellaceae bacterium]
MTDINQNHAEIKALPKISKIWLVPLIAILIGGWMVYYQWSSQGPLINIAFKSAEGMEAGKTKIKSLNVDIGKVVSIQLNEKADGVIVTARMSKSAEKLLVEDSKLWIVSPKVSLSGISGLSTLISGVYIELTAGKSETQQTSYVGLSEPPITPPGAPGLHITLNSDDQFAYSEGDPIIYKGLTVGQFEHIYFNFEERVVYYNAFIKAPYHKLVTSNTKFWDVSGLKVDLNADGLSVNTGNVETLLTNGVTFDVPEGMEVGEAITERAFFDIFPDYKTASDQRYKHSAKYIILVSDTIRGLDVGAPVEYRGVLIGNVLSTNVLLKESKELFKEDFKIPVLVGLQPGRVFLPDNDEGVNRMVEQNDLWIKKGLKASLKTGSLLTGQLFIELQHYDDQPISHIQYFEGFKVIPTMSGSLTQITEKASQFMDELNALELSALSKNANELISEITNTAKEFQKVSQNLESLLASSNQQKLAVQLANTLKSVEILGRDFSSDSKAYKEIQATLSSLT